MSEVFYRKFRPDNFDKMVGQKIAVNILTQCARKNLFHHAYLLIGHSGSGKTTAARILAMAVNCTNMKMGDHNPCGSCQSCLSIKADMAMDVCELDGASDGGKEEIRRVIESGLYSPVTLKKKVFIIDEAHELSNAAMTSLLKPTEEPNQDVLYILCTSEYNKVPSTVASRCMRIPFVPIKDGIISSYLSKLSTHIKADVEQDVFRQIAAVSGGNLRTSLNFFQSLLIQSNGKLTSDSARAMLGLVGRDDLYKIAYHIAKNSAGEALDVVESVMSTGPDVSAVCHGISEIFRNAMLFSANAKLGYTMSDMEKDSIEEISKLCTMKRLIGFVSKFTECEYSLTINHNKKWVLETLIASLCDKV